MAALTVSGAAAYGAVSSSTSTASAGAAKSSQIHLNFLVFQGPAQDTAARAVVAAYEKTHPNVSVSITAGSNAVEYPKMFAAHQTTPSQPLYNIVYLNPQTIAQGELDHMWLSLHVKQMKYTSQLFRMYRRPGYRGVPVGVGLVGLLYNTQAVKQPPTSWTDLWANQTYKNKVTLFNYLWPYNGLVMAAKLNGGSEVNAEPGFQAWEKGAGNIHTLITSTDQMFQQLSTGEVWLTGWVKSNQQVWASQGAPIGFAIPKEGAIAFPEYLGVVAGTTPAQQVAAEGIINLLVSPQYQAMWAETTFTAPSNPKAKLNAGLLKDPAFSPAVLKKAIQLNWLQIAKHDAAWRQEWDQNVTPKLGG